LTITHCSAGLYASSTSRAVRSTVAARGTRFKQVVRRSSLENEQLFDFWK